VYNHQFDCRRHTLQSTPHGVLPLGAARHESAHFLKAVALDDLALTVINLIGRHHEPDVVNRLTALNDIQRARYNLASPQELVRLGHGAPQALAATGCRNEGCHTRRRKITMRHRHALSFES
jgi:hypothetical protein